jgi:hypothetical protein
MSSAEQPDERSLPLSVDGRNEPGEARDALASSAAPQPAWSAYDAEDLASLAPADLIGLLVRDEDRAPRALIDACAARGEAMAERLASLVAPQSRWSDPQTDGEWWLRLHAVMILGLMQGERAGRLLLSFMRRMERANDEDLQDWLSGYWPIFFRNKPDSLVEPLRALAQDRSVDWYMRANAAEAVLAMAEGAGAQALDAGLDWAAAVASDASEDWDMRLSVASDLMDFPRERHRTLLENLAREQTGPGAFFNASEVAAAYDRAEDRPQWRERNNPWQFYERSVIAERQERWAREDGEELDEDDFEQLMPFVRAGPKVGRNAPCPCGSGKKYKKCCLGKVD